MVLAVLVSRAHGDKSDVSQIDLFKNTFFLQLGVDAPFLEKNGFTAEVHVYPDFPGNILSARFAPPGGSFVNMLEDGFGNFALGAIFATQAERDAAVPTGRYFFDLQTVTPPTQVTTSMNFFDQPPQTIPRLLNPDWYSVVLQFNSNQDYTFFWNDFVGFQDGTSGVGFEIVDIFNQIVVSELVFFQANQFTLSGGTLAPDQFYIGRLKFGNFSLEQDSFIDLFSYTLFTTEFIISAVDGPPVIQGPLDITVTAGQLFVYVISATNAPGNFNVTNLPDRVIFDPDYGLIGGFPENPGTKQLQLNATNSLGTGSATLTVTVLPAPPLAITSSTSARGRVGKRFKFQVHAPGATLQARLTATGLPPGLTADEATGLISGIPTVEGKFPVALKVTDGNATAEGTLELEFESDPAFLSIRSAHSVTLKPGQNFSYKIDAVSDSGAADDARFNIIGALPPGLSFDPATGIISGTYTGGAAKTGGARSSLSPDRASVSGGALIGNIQLFASNSRGTATMPLAFFLAPTGAVNISTRMGVGTGDNVIIGGFIVTGNAPKKLLIRGIGPSLERVGITGALQDPILELHGSAGHLVTNDDWKSDNQQDIAETTIPPSDDREPAIVGAFQPGSYTAIVRGKNNGTGTGLVELYDLGTASLETSSNATLAQISTRGTVQGGDNVMIGGFIISDIATKVIVRAIGPSLTQFGVPGALENTTLELFDSNGTSFAFNDDWKTDQEQPIRDTTVPPTDDRESAIVKTLSPGSYTAIVRGKNGAAGVALVEVYALK